MNFEEAQMSRDIAPTKNTLSQRPDPEWDQRMLKLAAHIGGWSRDRSRQIGCVIADSSYNIRTTGYNSFPRGISDNDNKRHMRPEKYRWTEHAERNAIFQAARFGISIDNCTMFTNLFPCIDCSRAIIQSGIVRICTAKPDFNDSVWGEQFAFSSKLFLEADVYVTIVDPEG